MTIKIKCDKCGKDYTVEEATKIKIELEPKMTNGFDQSFIP